MSKKRQSNPAAQTAADGGVEETGISRIFDREDALAEEEVRALLELIEGMSGGIREEQLIIDNSIERLRLVSLESKIRVQELSALLVAIVTSEGNLADDKSGSFVREKKNAILTSMNDEIPF